MQQTQAEDIPLSLLGPGLGYNWLARWKDTLTKQHAALQQKVLSECRPLWMLVPLVTKNTPQQQTTTAFWSLGKSQRWNHHLAYKARGKRARPWEEGWKLRGMPWSHIGRKMRPYPGCDRGGGAFDQRPLLFTRPWNSSQALASQREKKKWNKKTKKTALQIKGFLTFNKSRNIQWRLKGTRLQRARQYSLIALVDRSILKTQPNIWQRKAAFTFCTDTKRSHWLLAI